MVQCLPSMQEATGGIPKNTPTTIKKAQNPQIKRRQYRQVRAV